MSEYLVLTDAQGGRAVLTDETAACRYGIPVLLIDAEDVQGEFGPADVIGDLENPETLVHAAQVVHRWASDPARTEEERQAAHKFLRQWPEGPQLPE